MTVKTIRCYIERHPGPYGEIFIRDKVSGRIIRPLGLMFNPEHYQTFLAQARYKINRMPTIYDKTGVDSVVIRGFVVNEIKGEIWFCIDVENGGYHYECQRR